MKINTQPTPRINKYICNEGPNNNRVIKYTFKNPDWGNEMEKGFEKEE